MTAPRTIPTSTSTDLESFTVKINGTNLPSEVQLTSIMVRKEVNKIPFARLKFVDGDAAAETFTLSDGALLIPGKEIEILISISSFMAIGSQLN